MDVQPFQQEDTLENLQPSFEQVGDWQLSRGKTPSSGLSS